MQSRPVCCYDRSMGPGGWHVKDKEINSIFVRKNLPTYKKVRKRTDSQQLEYDISSRKTRRWSRRGSSCRPCTSSTGPLPPASPPGGSRGCWPGSPEAVRWSGGRWGEAPGSWWCSSAAPRACPPSTGGSSCRWPDPWSSGGRWHLPCSPWRTPEAGQCPDTGQRDHCPRIPRPPPQSDRENPWQRSRQCIWNRDYY